MKNIIAIILLSLSCQSLTASTEFPGRTKYPHVPTIELEELYQSRNNVVIVDSRSTYEYETLRIKNAVSVPLSLSSKRFAMKMQQIRDENPNKKIIFYCNGHTCMKSYKATRRSMNYLGFKNVYAYDTGVFDWARKYPEEADLLGDTLKDPSRLISKADFKLHTLPAEKFIKSANESIKILDIRDRINRDGFYIFSGDEHSIGLSKSEKTELDQFLDSVSISNKTLYVYDMVGKQVRWFQYYLEAKNIKKYYFMKGGADAFFNIPLSRLLDK